MAYYSFNKQFSFGKKYEDFLDTLFEHEFNIFPSTRQQDREGIDRIFFKKDTGKRYTIQYKADQKAAKTGNAFVETVSIDNQNKPGWAISCQADFLVYYIVDIGPAYILKPSDIRKNLPLWKATYPSKSSPNKEYFTIGLLVPLKEFERISVAIINP